MKNTIFYKSDSGGFSYPELSAWADFTFVLAFLTSQKSYRYIIATNLVLADFQKAPLKILLNNVRVCCKVSIYRWRNILFAGACWQKTRSS
jgi:hypothetical protein